MNHLFDSCAKQWWVSFFKVFNSGRPCRKTALNFSEVQIGAMKGSWKSVAEIFLLQIALGSATLSPHRSRCLRIGNFSPPIKSKNFFSSLPLSNCIHDPPNIFNQYSEYLFMDVPESPLILYLVIWYVFTTNNLLRFRLWDSSVTRLKYRFFWLLLIFILPTNLSYRDTFTIGKWS